MNITILLYTYTYFAVYKFFYNLIMPSQYPRIDKTLSGIKHQKDNKEEGRKTQRKTKEETVFTGTS